MNGQEEPYWVLLLRSFVSIKATIRVEQHGQQDFDEWESEIGGDCNIE